MNTRKQLLQTRVHSMFGVPIQMDTEEKRYLAALYLKTKSDPAAGEFAETMATIIGLERGNLSTTIYQLEEETCIKKTNFVGKIAITSRGITCAREILKGYRTTSIKFESYMVHDTFLRDTLDFTYTYHLTKPGQSSTRNSITISVSDIVCSNWGLDSWADQTSHRLPILHAKDRIIKKFLAGTLVEVEIFEIVSNMLSNLPNYTLENGIDVYDAEFYIFEPLSHRAPSIPTADIPDRIVQTRSAINIYFKKKYKEELLDVPQHDNIIDLTKGAASQDEFNMRLISLAGTAGEMNIDLLRKLSATNDPKIRSLQLLRKYLLTLHPDGDAIVKPVQYITTIRNAFPNHKTTMETIKAYNQLGISYPISQYSEAWITLLKIYLEFLEQLKRFLEQYML